ncbi:hypothetical protein DUI87_07417 [Hirundo rustica rustica]|uniref:Uncharacterized protein n=1 Tax=Hirundo rustica rustica TaxID=333673 RepID=A0A3M0KPQ3_HIRRU|nr:hypothetical protein DUI87_07417 [Hirundo rustica rustica]
MGWSEGAASWLRARTDNQGVPREPPNSCPSPCLSCSMASPHLNACLLFFAKKPHDQTDTSPFQEDWYIRYKKMLELQPDHIYMKKSFYANVSSTGEGCTGEEKQHSMEIHDAWQIGNLRLNSPGSLGRSSYERCSSHLIILMALRGTPSNMSISLQYWGSQNWCGPTSA